MTKSQLAEILKSGKNITIVDVRTHQEVQQISIPRALHIPLDELPQRLDEILGFSEVYFFCRAGVRSQVACEIAKVKNINAFSISNSILEIKEVTDSTFET